MHIIESGSELATLVKELNQTKIEGPITIFIRGSQILLESTLSIPFNLTLKSERPTTLYTRDGKSIFHIPESCTQFTLDGSAGLITLKKSDSESNTTGGAIFGGHEGFISIKNVLIHDCSANSGAGIYTRGSLSLDHVEIRNSIARDIGAAIAVEKNLTVRNSKIHNCTIINHSFEKNAANSKFSYLESVFYGGACAVNNGDVLIENSTISHNNVQKEAEGYCGALSVNTGNVLIRNSHLTNNSAYTVGGLMLGTGSMYIDRSEISNNRSTSTQANSGGAIMIRNGMLNVYHSKIRGNVTHGMFSGGVFSLFGDVDVNQSEISGNRSNGPGSAVACAFGSRLHVSNSMITNNAGAGLGAAFANFSRTGHISINNTTVADNILNSEVTMGDVLRAFVKLMMENHSPSMSIHREVMKDAVSMVSNLNLTGGIAGTLAAFGQAHIVDSKLINNQLIGPKTHGGVLFSLGSRNVCENSVFQENTTYGDESQGIVIFAHRHLELKNCTIENNGRRITKPLGKKILGTVYISEGSANLENTKIINNYAGYGAALYVNSSVKMTIDKATVTGNLASIQGGGIYTDTRIDNNESIITNNSPNNIHYNKE